jgi:3-isopropylmalate/(R)-2-methylmalate dehydratase small subunit
MEKFTALTATACLLDLVNIDTDQLLPARYLKLPRAAGLGQYLLRDLRFDEAGQARADFPLNKPECAGAKILVAGRNFGGGSSREAAVYALYDFGIRCVIASSFGDIFSQNSAKNGLLTAAVAEPDIAQIAAMLREAPATQARVDLEAQIIEVAGKRYSFTIDPTRRMRLLNGWDDIALTQSHREQIAEFRQDDIRKRPWAGPPRA